MNPDSKRVLIATVVCMFLLFGWMQVTRKLYPPPPPATQPANPAPPAVEATPTSATPAIAAPNSGGAPVTSGPVGYTVSPGASNETLTLGIDTPRNAESQNPYYLFLALNPRGAAIVDAQLTDARNSVARGRHAKPDNYNLLRPVIDPSNGQLIDSLSTRRLVLVGEKVDLDLSDVLWTGSRVSEQDGEAVRFSTTVLRNGVPSLEIRKTYRLQHNVRAISLDLEIENVGDAQQNFTLVQSGPLGFKQEDMRWDDRHAYNYMSDGKIKAHTRQEVWRAEDHDLPLSREGASVTWAAVANKYFGCIMAPIPGGAGSTVDFVRKVSARTMVGVDTIDPKRGDLTIEWVIAPPTPLMPKSKFACSFNCYMGARDPSYLTADPLASRFQFDKIYAADRSPCTFDWLATGIAWLFSFLHRILPGQHNYGFAIIILVLIVRSLLHPLTKRGQTQMFKTQKVMASFAPKLEALKQKYANDKPKLNAEMLELYRSEGVNPAAGSILGCLPMLLQMPVWVALWSTLNSSIALRHEPFVPLQWWIPDLAAPDAVISFPNYAFKIPLLSDSFMIGPISSLNILPILMGVTMWWQQKYSMKMSRPATPPPPSTPSPDGKPSMADQMEMQQKMMSYMTIFFSLMFYNFPSGLSVYILTSSLLGMLEQHHIREQLKKLDAEGKLLKPPKPPPAGGPGPNWLQKLQKKAEEARQLRSDVPKR